MPPRTFVDVPVPASTRFGLFNGSDAKTMIPVYGLFKLSQASEAQSELDAKLQDRGFDPATELQQLLVTKLELRDVQTRTLSVQRPHKLIPPKLDLATLSLQSDTWAVLDARVTGVGLDADMSGEFRPSVVLLVQLIEARTNRVLYDNRFAYNARPAKAVRIPYDPRAQWPDIASVQGDLPRVCEAIVAALDQMADLIANDISSRKVVAK